MSSPTPPYSYGPGPWAESRIGVVALATPNSLLVDVGGERIDVAFLIPFVTAPVAPPAVGSVVQLIRQDATWICTGRLVGAGSNSVLNPGFEDSAPGSEPIDWFTANAAGSAVATVYDAPNTPDGDFVARVYAASSATHVLYSSPIPVNAGEQWSLSAFVGGEYNGGPETADAGLIALWFANATDLYPTTSAADSIAATSADIPTAPPYRSIAGTVTVPAASPFMRVALRSTLTADQALLWDSTIARRV